MMANRNNQSVGIELIINWLINSIFVGFRFGSNFTLFFDRQTEASFNGKVLPSQLKLELLEDWWFGNEKDWQLNVNKNGSGVEPDEPVKAFELAKLRWSEGAIVKSVVADEQGLVLEFENGVFLQVRLTGEDELTYLLSENNIGVEGGGWSVALESDGIFSKVP